MRELYLSCIDTSITSLQATKRNVAIHKFIIGLLRRNLLVSPRNDDERLSYLKRNNQTNKALEANFSIIGVNNVSSSLRIISLSSIFCPSLFKFISPFAT